MRRFGKQTLFFIAPLIVAAALWFVYYWVMTMIVSSRMNEIAKNEVLIMGDSQMQRINPVYFTKPTYNFASSGEHFYFTFQKLKTLTSIEKSNIKQVVLGVSAHSFAPVYTKFFDPGSPEGQKSLGHYFYFFDGNEFFRKKDLFDMASLKRVLFGTPDWGGLFESDLANPDTARIERALKMHFGGTGAECSTSQLTYLDAIVGHCQRNDIELILVSTPYHPYYHSRVDDIYFQILRKMVNEYLALTYLNFLDTNMSTDLMSDGNHLNKRGAEIYSRQINEEINR